MLHALWERDGRSVGAVAERLALESSTVTPLVKRMEAAGLVDRRRNPADERQVRLFLTPAGQAMRARCGCLSERLVERSRLTFDQLAALNAQVQLLRDSLVASAPD